MTASEPLLHVALYQPEIPPNTGNIGRTCLAIGAKLWLIRPLGFSLDSRYIKKAGMDYWPQLDYGVLDNWDAAVNEFAGHRIWRVTKFAEQMVWDATFQRGDVFLFGSESSGLPEDIREAEPDRKIGLPMRKEVRSLNLASTANTIVYEAVRQFGGLPKS